MTVSMVASSEDRKTDSNTSPSIPGSPTPQTTKTREGHQLWKFHLRPDDDDEETDWWFASTAIPLLAATTGPLANMLSIAALVTSWRQERPDHGAGKDADSLGYPDPRWCLGLNGASLACGFVGNFFLLLNFTRRIRYIVALPMTIILWYFATGILISIIVAINRYVPPVRPQETYSQGFWYAIIAAVLYLCSSMALMVNMMGYFLGHYPQHFTLTDHQRTLILQTMIFFLWLAGGAGVFARVCGWRYVDALYFCDVTILTVGFGDFSPPNDLGRGLVFPFSVGGIIMLGLMVGSINRFTGELSHDKIIKKHVERKRQRTVGRSVTVEESAPIEKVPTIDGHLQISEPYELRQRSITFDEAGAAAHTPDDDDDNDDDDDSTRPGRSRRHRAGSALAKRMRRPHRRDKVLILKEEKDRFDAMRSIQYSTLKFKRWYNLGISVTAFGLLWCVGAVVFWVAEEREQHLSYFQALYFCYVSLLTIGYGDLAPKSNAGKPFFVVWSLLAVPTMTILIGDMADTVIRSFKHGTTTVADWTVLPKAGVWQKLLDRLGFIGWVQRRAARQAEARRVAAGFPVAGEGDGVDDAAAAGVPDPLTIEELADGEPTEHDLARRLAFAIRRTALHLNDDPPKRYRYEEWAEYTRLIRFSSESAHDAEVEEATDGLIEWDWIGEDSPMLAKESEAEWVLDRLCESLVRYMARQARKRKKRKRRKSQATMEPKPEGGWRGDGPSDAVVWSDGE